MSALAAVDPITSFAPLIAANKDRVPYSKKEHERLRAFHKKMDQGGVPREEFNTTLDDVSAQTKAHSCQSGRGRTMVQQPSTGRTSVLVSCPPQLSSSVVLLSCPPQLSSLVVLLSCPPQCPPQLSSSVVLLSCPPQLSSSVVLLSCLPQLSSSVVLLSVLLSCPP